MEVIADLEVHSKYARAVSASMTVPVIAQWAEKKGIGLVGTGDFTHPMWFRELEAGLEEEKAGIYKLKSKPDLSVRFLLTSEVSCIYTHEGRGRRVHMMIFLPTLSSVRKFNEELTKRGANLFSDGRPMMGLSLAQVAESAFSVDEKAIIIPAHVWTPWFGFYGHMSGYDSLAEAFGDLQKKIPAVETGLSSDPAMNWRIDELKQRRIVSFGDAHSPQKLGREATAFELDELSYDAIGRAVWGKSPDRISYTIEFYPEEGKYHYTGHRKCNIVYSPNEARKLGLKCPVCGRSLTMGVMSRVEALAGGDIETKSDTDRFGVRWIGDKNEVHPPYVMLVPLLEIISESLNVGVGSQKVTDLYELLIAHFGNEFSVLLKANTDDIERIAGDKVAEAVLKVRTGDITIDPGYDGVFGKVSIWNERKMNNNDISKDQSSLF